MVTNRKLTRAQAKELRLLSDKGRQNTFGSGRARVQNNLYYGVHYVRFINFSGEEVKPHEMGLTSPDVEWCEITEAGRKALAEYEQIHPVAKGIKSCRVK